MHQTRLLLWCVVAVLAIMLASGFGPAQGRQIQVGPPANIIKLKRTRIAALNYDWTTGYELMIMNLDGTNQQLISGPSCRPSWSPDGRKIAHSINVDSRTQLYTRDIYTHQLRQLTFAPAQHFDPAWSPDGTKIAYVSDVGGVGVEIWVMNADGSNPVKLTANGGNASPSWSPNGSKIYFSRGFIDSEEIYVMNADGSNVTRLTFNNAWDFEPCISPDGTKIAFTSNRTGDYEVFVMNADGSNPVNMTNSPGSDGTPAWSPDGTKILFYSGRAGDYEIFMMNAKGTNPVNLTNNADDDLSPTW